MADRIQIVITAIDQLVNVVKAQTLALNQMQQSLNRTAQAANQANRAMGATATATNQATQGMRATTTAATQVTAALHGWAPAANQATQAFSKMGAGVIVLNQLHELATKLSTSLYEAGKTIVQTGAGFESAFNTLRAITGSNREAAEGMKTVSDISKRMGLNVLEASESFAKIQAAGKGTALAGDEATRAFTAVAQASTVMGLSASKTELLFFALQQIMSKGRLASEEVRRQFAETLPGGFAVFARAAGLSMKEFDKALRDGTLNAIEFIPKLSREIEKTFPITDRILEQTRVAIGRFQTAWLELVNAVFRAGLGESFKDAANGLTFLITKLKEFAEAAPGVVKLATNFGIATASILALTGAIGSFLLIKSTLGPALLGIGVSMGVFAAAVAGVTLAITGLSRALHFLDADLTSKSTEEFVKQLDKINSRLETLAKLKGILGGNWIGQLLDKLNDFVTGKFQRSGKEIAEAIGDRTPDSEDTINAPFRLAPNADETTDKIKDLIERLRIEAARVGVDTARAITQGKVAFLKEIAQNSTDNIESFLGASLDAIKQEYLATLRFIKLDLAKDLKDAGGNKDARSAAFSVANAKTTQASQVAENKRVDVFRDIAKLYEKAAADLDKAKDQRDKLEIESLRERTDLAQAQLKLLQDQNSPLNEQIEKLRQIDSLEKQRITNSLNIAQARLTSARGDLRAELSDTNDPTRILELQNKIRELENDVNELETAAVNAGKALSNALATGAIADARLPNRIAAHESITSALQQQLDIARAQNAHDSVTKTLQSAILDSERKILDIQIAQTNEQIRQLALKGQDTKAEGEALEAQRARLQAARDTVGNFAVEARALAETTARDFVDRFLEVLDGDKDAFKRFFLGLGKTIVADIFQESIADSLQATFQKQLQEGAQIPKTVGGQLLFSIREAFPGLQGVLGANQRKQLTQTEQAVLEAQKKIGGAGDTLNTSVAPKLLTAGDKLIEAAHALQAAAGVRGGGGGRGAPVPVTPESPFTPLPDNSLTPEQYRENLKNLRDSFRPIDEWDITGQPSGGFVQRAGASPGDTPEVEIGEGSTEHIGDAFSDALEGFAQAQKQQAQSAAAAGTSPATQSFQTPLTATNGLLGGLGETAFGIGAFNAAGPGVDGILQQVQGFLSVFRGILSAWQAIDALTAGLAAVDGISAGLGAAEGAGAFTDLAAMGFAHGGMVVPQSAMHKFASGGRVMGGPVYGMVGEEGSELVARMLPARPEDMNQGGGPIEQTIYIVDQRPKGITGKDAVVLVADNIERNGLVAKAVLNTKRRS
jgi:tape measure domain-containing protein